MLTRLRKQMTYANVMATIAVCVALGGTSYAAFTLPRNSVGHRQIQTGAVRGAEIRDGALGVKELSRSAQRSLRGATGPAGPAGPGGPPGTSLFAVVDGGGNPTSGNATQGGLTGTGTYQIGFSRSLTGCAVAGSLGTSDASTAVAGRITVNLVDGKAGVQTYAADGSPANLPFHLIVVC